MSKRLCGIMFVLAASLPRVAAGATDTIVGTWLGEVFDGYQETLILFANGAYKSTTVIAAPDALKEHLATDCRERIRPKRPKQRCNATWVDAEFGKLAGLFPQTQIGTYELRSARIAFTHGCAEEVRDCKIGSITDEGLLFIEKDALTIKLNGTAYRGRMVGAVTSTYRRRN